MIRLIGFLLTFMFLISCKTTNKTISPKNFKEGTIVFETYSESNDEGKIAIESMFDSIVKKNTEDTTDVYAKSEISALKSIALSDILQSKKSELVIAVQQDTIIRFKKYLDESGIPPYEKLRKHDGWMSYYSQSISHHKEQIIPDSEIDLFKNNISYNVEIDKKDRKKILKYECYKITIISKGGNISDEFGDTIYEMYVTEQLDLPAHAVINFGKLFTFFPLEIVTYSANIKGLKDIYKVKSIELK